MGCSDNQVFRIIRPEEPTCYLKIAPHPLEPDLLAEKERLDWLQGQLPVPSIYAFASTRSYTYLLQSEIPGVIACDEIFAQDVPTLARLLAKGLRTIHQIDYTSCPFDQSNAYKIYQARRRVEMDLVDESLFDKQRQGMRADELFELLIESQPYEEELVFTHGDYCLPNILIDPSHSEITGFIDWGRAGIADRYHDLALAVRSLSRNFAPDWEPFFWEAYGLENINHAKIEFYQLLDEFPVILLVSKRILIEQFFGVGHRTD